MSDNKIKNKQQAVAQKEQNKPEKLNRHSRNRRRLLTSAAAGGAIASSVPPEKWAKPVIESVLLPAHARTSDPGTFSAVLEVTGDGDISSGPFPANLPFSFSQGDYNFDSYDDDLTLLFHGTVSPAVAGTTINLLLDADDDWDTSNSGSFSTTTNVNGAFDFSDQVDIETDEADDEAVFIATFSSPGISGSQVIRLTLDD